MTAHRVEAISFRRGVVDCSCGAEVRNDQDTPDLTGRALARAGTPEALRGAFSAHRSTYGLVSRSALGLGHDHDGAATPFSRDNGGER